MQPHSKNNIPNRFSRIALWLVVVSLCWCCAGMVLWGGVRAVCYRMVQVHKERKCDTLHLPATMLKGGTDALVWMQKDEIRFRGKMFDIKHRVNHPGGMVSLIGYYDSYEDKLFKVLRKLVDDDGNQGNGSSREPVWNITAIIPKAFSYPAHQMAADTQSVYPYRQAIYHSLHISPPAPPPDVAAV